MSLNRLARPVATVLAGIVAIAMVFVGLVALAPQALAAVNTNIKIENLQLIKTNSGGAGNPDGPLWLYSNADLTFDWDATTANPKPGDSFGIIIPSYFKFAEVVSRPLKTAAGLVVGNCTTANGSGVDRALTCTFNDAIVGNKNIRGNGRVNMQAIRTTTTSTSTFTIMGGGEVELPNPENQPITVQPLVWKPIEFSKWADNLKEDHTSVKWGIRFTPYWLSNPSYGTAEAFQQVAENDPSSLAVPPNEFCFNDMLDELQTFDGVASNVELAMLVTKNPQPNQTGYTALVNAMGENLSPTFNSGNAYSVRYEVDPSDASGRTVKFCASGPWEATANYAIRFRANIDSGKVQPNVIYRNKATTSFTTVTANSQVFYTDSFEIIAQMDAGFGTYKIVKVVTGAGANQVPAGKKFNVKVSWTLPDGKTPADYPAWTAPTANPFSQEVEAGATSASAYTFPHGTVITLSEDQPTDDPGVIWGTPTFEIGGSATNTFSIRDQVAANVQLKNVANPSGTFKVVKKGEGADISGKTFKFEYSCTVPGVTAPVTGDLTVTGQGEQSVGRYFPVGTTCTVNEVTTGAGVDVQIPNYTLTPPAAQNVTIAAGEQTLTFTNTYTKEVGSLSVKKEVSGQFPDGFNQATKTFKVKVSCPGFHESILDVPGNGVAVPFSDAIPAGTVCTVEELNDAGLPATHAVTTTYSPSASVTVAKDAQEVATVKNSYSIKTGTFEVVKSVSGDDGTAAGKTFNFEYRCTSSVAGQDDVTGTISGVKGDSVPVPSNKQVPIGSKCTVTEVAASAALAGYTWTPTTPVELTIGSETTPARFEFTNAYTKDLGDLKVTKKLVAEDRFTAPAEGFEITASCDDGTVKTEKLHKDGSFTVTGLPTGTKCTITEANADVAGYTRVTTIGLEADPATGQSEVPIGKDTTVSVVVTNEYTPKTGDFSVTKTVTGDAGSLVAADKEFQIAYACTALDGKPAESGSFTLKHGETKEVTGVREGTCTVTETGADVANTDRTTTIKVGASDTTGDSAVVTIVQGQEGPTVAITNNYMLHRGGFGVVKSVDADAASNVDADKEFSFTYECSEGTSGAVNGVKADGNIVDAGVQLPVGTTCTVTEVAATAQVDGHTVVTEDPKTVTIGHDTIVEAAFVNTYTRDMGSFALAKKVVGVDGSARNYTFTYTCEAAGSGSLTVKGDGRSTASGVQVPTGTKCTVKEDMDKAKVQGYSLRAASEVSFTVEAKDQVVDVEFTNTYTPEPKPGKLSTTGATIAGVLGGAAATLALGLAALAIRRKRNS